MNTLKNRRRIVLLAGLLLSVFLSSSPAKAVAEDASLRALTKNLATLTDGHGLTAHMENSLQVWDRPGVVWLPAVKLSAEQIRGDQLDEHIKSLLKSTFGKSEIVPGVPQPMALADGPLVTLKNAKQQGPLSEDCEWPADKQGKWFAVPGDYLRDQCLRVMKDGSCEVGKESQPTLTLIYHHKTQPVPLPKGKKVVDPFGNPMERLIDAHGDENYYFGVRQSQGVWRVISFGTDANCDA